jgi:hypothetical protein
MSPCLQSPRNNFSVIHFSVNSLPWTPYHLTSQQLRQREHHVRSDRVLTNPRNRSSGAIDCASLRQRSSASTAETPWQTNAASIPCSGEGIAPTWFSSVSGNVGGHPVRAVGQPLPKINSRTRVHHLVTFLSRQVVIRLIVLEPWRCRPNRRRDQRWIRQV